MSYYILLFVLYGMLGYTTLQYLWQLDTEADVDNSDDDRVIIAVFVTGVLAWPLFLVAFALAHLVGFGRVPRE